MYFFFRELRFLIIGVRIRYELYSAYKNETAELIQLYNPNNLECDTNYLFGAANSDTLIIRNHHRSLIDEPFRQIERHDRPPYWQWQSNIYICATWSKMRLLALSPHTWWSCAPTTHPLSRKLLHSNHNVTHQLSGAAWCDALHIHSNILYR